MLLEKSQGILDITFFTDEAWFHLSVYMNLKIHNFGHHREPHGLHEQSLHDKKNYSEGWN